VIGVAPRSPDEKESRPTRTGRPSGGHYLGSSNRRIPRGAGDVARRGSDVAARIVCVHVVAAEQIAVARGDRWPCACCTDNQVRRAALDRLAAQRRQGDLALAFLRANGAAS